MPVLRLPTQNRPALPILVARASFYNFLGIVRVSMLTYSYAAFRGKGVVSPLGGGRRFSLLVPQREDPRLKVERGSFLFIAKKSPTGGGSVGPMRFLVFELLKVARAYTRRPNRKQFFSTQKC